MVVSSLSCVYLLNWEGSETLVKDNSNLTTHFSSPRDPSVLLFNVIKTL